MAHLAVDVGLPGRRVPVTMRADASSRGVEPIYSRRMRRHDGWGRAAVPVAAVVLLSVVACTGGGHPSAPASSAAAAARATPSSAGTGSSRSAGQRVPGRRGCAARAGSGDGSRHDRVPRRPAVPRAGERRIRRPALRPAADLPEGRPAAEGARLGDRHRPGHRGAAGVRPRLQRRWPEVGDGRRPDRRLPAPRGRTRRHPGRAGRHGRSLHRRGGRFHREAGHRLGGARKAPARSSSRPTAPRSPGSRPRCTPSSRATTTRATRPPSRSRSTSPPAGRASPTACRRGGRRAAGRTVWRYREDRPMATELVQVAVGDLRMFRRPDEQGVQVRDVVPRRLLSAARAELAGQDGQIAWMTARVGPFPFPVYGRLAADAELAALETQTLTIVPSSYLALPAGPRDQVLLHELAHQWFGDTVSPAQWSDVWLNEGHATWYQMLYGAEQGSLRSTFPGSDLEGVMRAEYRRSDQLRRQFGPPAAPASAASLRALFNPDVYAGGALVLYALRQEIGTTAFEEVERGGSAITATAWRRPRTTSLSPRRSPAGTCGRSWTPGCTARRRRRCRGIPAGGPTVRVDRRPRACRACRGGRVPAVAVGRPRRARPLRRLRRAGRRRRSSCACTASAGRTRTGSPSRRSWPARTGCSPSTSAASGSPAAATAAPRSPRTPAAAPVRHRGRRRARDPPRQLHGRAHRGARGRGAPP